MNKPVFIQTPVDTETRDAIARVTRAYGTSEAEFAASVVRRAALDEAEFLASLDEAERQIDAGDFLTHEQVVAWWEERRKRAPSK